MFALTALFVATLSLMTAFGGGIFDVVVNEENLARGFPESITHVRNYWKYRNPGDFYKFITPLFALSSLFSLYSYWEAPSLRWLILGAIACYTLTQAITGIYFFPQNRLLREGSIDEVTNLLTTVKTTRLYLDYFRNALTLAGSVLLLLAVSKA